jgi:HEPN domain-containing protein
MRQESNQWWQQALEDLDTAEKNFDIRKFYVAAFYCQQSVEKALKALFLEKKRDLPPKTHNLLELAKGVSAPEELYSSLRKLNVAYATSRYPDAANGLPRDVFDDPIAQELIEGARRSIEWMKKALGT